MRTNSEGDETLLSLVDAGDRTALARVTRRVVARLRAIGAYDLEGRWDDACREIVTNLLEAMRSGTDDAEDLQRRIDRAVWMRIASYLRRNPLSGRPGGALGPRGRAAGAALDADRPRRLAARQAFARIARERQELLWRRYLGGEAMERLTGGAVRSKREVERELAVGRAEFRKLLEIAGSVNPAGAAGDQPAPLDVAAGASLGVAARPQAAEEPGEEGGSP